MKPIFFVAGGTLISGSPSYVERAADRELLAALRASDYCYILDSRQKGKSSLILHADQRIRASGIETVRLDLQRYGSNVTTEQWFAGMLNDVGEDLELTNELFEYWRSHQEFGPARRFFGALADVVLVARRRPIVIFVDEIDFVLNLPFSADEFFAAIREMYNRRTVEPAFRRLRFCLAGVATPSSLVRSVQITPLNIGRRIELTDFTVAELAVYAHALGPSGRAVVKRVHHWTGGHPYLTQRICAELAAVGARSNRAVDRVVAKLFFSDESRREEPNLADVSRRLLETKLPDFSPEESRARLLELYRELRDGTRKVADDETDPFAERLKLFGLTRTVEGRLRVRNRVYARVFDGPWIENNLPDAERRRQTAAFRRGMIRATAAIFAGLALVGIPLIIAVNALDASAASLRLAKMQASFSSDVLHSQRMLEIQSLWNRNGRGISAIRALLQGDALGYQSAFEVQYYRRLVRMAAFTIRPPDQGSFTAVGGAPNEIAAGTSNGTVVSLAENGAEGSSAQLGASAIDRIAATGTANGTDTGGQFLIADAAGGLYRWSPESGSEAELLPRKAVRWKALAAHGTATWAIGSDGILRTQVGSAPAKFGRLPARRVRCAAISAASNRGAFVDSPDQVTLFALNTQTVTGRFRLPEGEGASWIAFSNDGRRLAVGEHQKFVRLLDASSGTQDWVSSTENSGGSVAFSPDGKRVLVAGSDNSIEVLRVRDGLRLFIHKGHDEAIVQATFAGDGRIVSIAPDELMGWEGQYGVDTHIMQPPRARDVTAIDVGPTFRLILTGHANGDLCLWRPFRSALVARHPGRGIPATAVTVSPDGSRWAAGFGDGTVEAGNLSELSLTHSPGRADGAVTVLAFSPDGTALAAGTATGEVARFDLTLGTRTARRQFGGPVAGLSYDPVDAGVLAVAADRLWVMNATKLSALSGWKPDAMLSPSCVAFSPDGRRIAAAERASGLLRLFDFATRKASEEFRGFDQRVRACAFSPDGKRLAATDDSGVTAMLGVDAPGEIVPELEFTYPVTTYATLRFKPDGSALFGGSVKGWSQYWFGDYVAPDEPYP